MKDEARFADVRKQYAPHVARMLELAGDKPAEAAEAARQVVAIETALAKGSLERVKRRDPANRYHMTRRADLAEKTPALAWDGYFAAVGAPPAAELNVVWPPFFEAVQEVIETSELAALKSYLRWFTISAAAPLLPAKFVNEDFAFFGKTLTGAKELRPRWKRCVALVDDHLGEALGQRYVEQTFGAEGKERMAAMVAALERALEKDIKDLPWMTDATKKQAQAKLAAITNKIGFPDKWRDYRALKVARNDALGNAERAEAFELRRQLAKIGQPVDRGEWLMTPPTVNAYYMALQNNINFPAGILQPPFFERAMDDAVNFGAVGSVIGHELTHGFDDQGRKFAASGDLADWWTAEDATEFEKRTQCLVDQYGEYTVAGGVKLNGRLTLGENTADNGGVRIAHMALMDTLAGKPAPPLARRVHARAAALPGLGPDLVPERDRGEQQAAGADGLALAGPVPRERGGLEHARVPGSLRLSGGLADGAREALPGVVERRHGTASLAPQPHDRRRLRRHRRVPGLGRDDGPPAVRAGVDLLGRVPGADRVRDPLARRPRVPGVAEPPWPSTASSTAATRPAAGWRPSPAAAGAAGKGRPCARPAGGCAPRWRRWSRTPSRSTSWRTCASRRPRGTGSSPIGRSAAGWSARPSRPTAPRPRPWSPSSP